MDEAAKVCVSTPASGGASSVLRSASDTAIMTVAEAWELSLAAASASKDKRVKDVKNTSLKQQGTKKRGAAKPTNETAVLSVNDGHYEFIFLDYFIITEVEPRMARLGPD